MKKVLKAIEESAIINVCIFMLGFMIMGAMGYAQEGEVIGTITCIIGGIIAAFGIKGETKNVEALCYNYEEDDDTKEE